jgi:hypothetical protein
MYLLNKVYDDPFQVITNKDIILEYGYYATNIQNKESMSATHP